MYIGAKPYECNTRKMWANANNKYVQKEKFKYIHICNISIKILEIKV